MVRKVGVKWFFFVGWFIGELKFFIIVGNYFFILVKILFMWMCYGVGVVIVFIYVDKIIMFVVFIGCEWYIIDIILWGVVY